AHDLALLVDETWQGIRARRDLPVAPRAALFLSRAAGLSGQPGRRQDMRLFILGANGKTGTQLVDLALARNHQVTAFVRSPEKITRRHPNLQVLHGDPRNVHEMARVLPGHDAVLSALGVRPPQAFRPHT